MKIVSVVFLFFLAGCAANNPPQDDPYVSVLNPQLCGYLSSQKTTGLIVSDYNSSLNTIRYSNIESGVVVSNIIVGSSADSSEIKVGDVITKINGEVIYSQDQFVVLGRNSTDDVVYTVTNDKAEKEILIKKDFFHKFITNCTHRLRLPKR